MAVDNIGIDHAGQLSARPIGIEIDVVGRFIAEADTRQKLLVFALKPGAVAALITAVRDQLGAASLTTIAIGGDRDYLVQRIPDLTAGPDDFTLRGIAYAATMI